jgi:hypothetical protein
LRWGHRVHLLEPERRPLEAGVDQVRVVELPIAGHGAPEGQHIGNDHRVDRDLDGLQAGQVDRDVQFARAAAEIFRASATSHSLRRPSLLDLRRTVTPSDRRSTSG